MYAFFPILLPWLLGGLRVVATAPPARPQHTSQVVAQRVSPQLVLPPTLLPLAAQSPPFRADSAWQEFTTLLRGHYAYFTRPGIEGEAILKAFALRATAAPTKEAFRNVLQLVAHNFADPHFIVGPLDSADYNIVPTSSDLVARYRAPRFEVLDVRRASDAAQYGIRPGATVLRIEGCSPQQAIEQVMGRPFATLTLLQVEAGLNTALAGRRYHSRHLTLAVDGTPRAYTLRSPGEQAQRLRTAAPLSVVQQGKVAIIRFNNSLGNDATIAAFRVAMAQVQASPGLVLDFRNTPSGGNTTVARGIMGYFVRTEQPYQVHVVPSEERLYGVPRKFVEYVLPLAPFYAGKVIVLGDHWTGSMGEGLVVGFNALGVPTAGSELADLLGGLFNERLARCEALVDLGEEQILQVNGQPREDFVPSLYRVASEGTGEQDELLAQAIRAVQ
jgi:carboxyl-terminal processing protease